MKAATLWKRLKTGLILLSDVMAILLIYYLVPSEQIPDGTVIDRIIVYKSQHKLQAFSAGRLVATYTVAIGKKPVGPKEYEGDKKTPEGIYRINARNAYSGYHKNLGISYPAAADRARAVQAGRSPGGDVKIHGLENGKGYIGKFHRWLDWTNGCIAVDNAEMDMLYEHVMQNAVIEIRK